MKCVYHPDADAVGACVNCGSYFRANEGYRGSYCSPECAVQYKISRFMDTVTTNTLIKELV